MHIFILIFYTVFNILYIYDILMLPLCLMIFLDIILK